MISPFDVSKAGRPARSGRDLTRRPRTMSTFAGTFMLILTLAVVLVPGMAAATDINGWESHTGADYELMMASSNEVGAMELVQLINYDVHDLRLELWQVNGTMIMSQTVAPQSSAFVQLDYGTVDCRIDIVSSYYGLEGSYTRVHVYELLPPPVDNGGWSGPQVPPSTQDPDLIFTQAQWDQMLSWITMQVAIYAIVAGAIGYIVGALVKKKTYFQTPKDLVSIAVFALVLTDTVMDWTGLHVDAIYHAAFLVGYLLGFFIAYVPYVEAEYWDLEGKTHVMRPVVLYSPDGDIGYCIQQQSNLALLKRWCGIHHRLGADAAIAPDWATSVKVPGKKRIRCMSIMVEKELTEYEEVPFLRFFTVRKYSTQWSLSNGSKMPMVLWIKSSGTILWMKDLIKRLYTDLVSERQRAETLATQIAGEMHSYTIERSTHRGMAELFSNPVPPVTVRPLRQYEMRQADKAASKPQRTPAGSESGDEVKRRDESDEEPEPTNDRSERKSKRKEQGD